MSEHSFRKVSGREREKEVRSRSQRGLGYCKSDLPVFVPIDGDNQIRILPCLSDDPNADLWGMTVWTYFIQNRVYLSPRTFDENLRDPISEYFFELRDKDPDAAKAYRGVKRNLMFILDFNEEVEGELKIWAAPPTLIDSFINLSKNRGTGELIPLEDPDEGRIIYFTKSGTGVNTKYDGVQIADVYPIEAELAKRLDYFADILDVPLVEDMEDVLEREKGNGGDVVPESRGRVRDEDEDERKGESGGTKDEGGDNKDDTDSKAEKLRREVQEKLAAARTRGDV